MTAMDNLSECRMDMEDVALAEAQGHFLTYIRPVEIGEHKGYGIYTGDGIQLAVFSSHEAAFFSARQQNLTPLSVH